MSSAPGQVTSPRVWVTVVDPQSTDGREAVAAWNAGGSAQAAISARAATDEYVLAWLTGGMGFRYLLRVHDRQVNANAPQVSADAEDPTPALLSRVELIHPAVTLSRLKGDPSLRTWWLAQYNMQGV